MATRLKHKPSIVIHEKQNGDIASSDKPKTRNKPSLVCFNCKRKKIKCDRKLPCSACVKTNRAHECQFGPRWHPRLYHRTQSLTGTHVKAAAKKIDFDDSVPQPGNSMFEDLKQRLWKLESTIVPKHTDEANASGAPVASASKQIDTTHQANPIEEPDETINFFEHYSPFMVKGPTRRINHGPLLWTTFMRKDPWLNVLVEFASTDSQAYPYLLYNSPMRITAEAITLLRADEDETAPMDESTKSKRSDLHFRKRALELEGLDYLAPLVSLVESSQTPQGEGANSQEVTSKTNLRQSIVSLGQSHFQGKVSPELQLIDQIRANIPKRKLVWKLIDHYFEHLYPFMPFLDEFDFKAKVMRIVGGPNLISTNVDEVRIINKLDLASLSILFIVLRLTYVSLFDNNMMAHEDAISSTKDEALSDGERNLQYLMKTPVNSVLVEVARLCLAQFNVARKSNMTVFQGYFFMRLYNIYAPEEGDAFDGGDSRISNAMLIQMALSLGLNREPDKFPEDFKDHRENLLGRKMWWYLVAQDLSYCLSVGNHTSIPPRYHDTSPPYYREGNANTRNIDHELAAVRLYRWFYQRSGKFHQVCEMVLDIPGRVLLAQLTEAITFMEREANSNAVLRGDVDEKDPVEIPAHLQELSLLMGLQVAFYLQSLLILLLHHVFLHYEYKHNDELAFYYCKKMHSLILFHILPHCFETLCGKHSKNSFTLNPILQIAVHKSNQFILAVAMRVGYLLHNLRESLNHSVRLAEDLPYRYGFNFMELLLTRYIEVGELFTKVMAKLSLKYYYAWRITKAQSYACRSLRRKEFYRSIPQDRCTFHFTQARMDELLGLLDGSKEWLERITMPQSNAGAAPKKRKRTAKKRPPAASPPPAVYEALDFTQGQPGPYTPLSANSSTGDVADNALVDLEDNNAISTLSEEIDQMWLLMLATRYNPHASHSDSSWEANMPELSELNATATGGPAPPSVAAASLLNPTLPPMPPGPTNHYG